MSKRKTMYLIAALVFFAVTLGFGVYIVQKTQTIENRAQVVNANISESSCLSQGGTVISADLAGTQCPSGYTKIGDIEGSIVDNQTLNDTNSALDTNQVDQFGNGDNNNGDGPTNTVPTSSNTPPKICCVPLPTEPLPTQPLPTEEPSPTNIPTSTPEISIEPSPSHSPVSATPTINIVTPTSINAPSTSPTEIINMCIDPRKVPQLNVSIEYICPACK